MTLITLAFAPEMEDAIIAGKKCCTTRREKHGEVGDLFVVRDRVYRICHIHHCLLYSARDGYYDAEGFEFPGDFEEFWATNVERFDHSKIVHLHFFAYIGPTGYYDKCMGCPIFETDAEGHCDRIFDEKGYHCEVRI